MDRPDPSASPRAAQPARRPPADASDAFVFARAFPGFDTFRLRPLRIPEDIGLVHAWVSAPGATYWGLVGRSVEQVTATYREISRRADVFMGYQGAEPAFIVELYDPREDEVGKHYSACEGDRGMHLLVAPTERPLHGFTWAVFRVVMEFSFDDPLVQRVVVEPDIRNARIHALNRRAGFQYEKLIELPGKSAHLAFCTRQAYAAVVSGLASRSVEPRDTPLSRAEHLDPEVWARVNARLVRKIISELSHERLLEPRRIDSREGWEEYRLGTDRESVEYHFRARVLELWHWDIDTPSIEKYAGGGRAPLDAVSLILELRDTLRLEPALLLVYMEEVLSTLYGAAYKDARQRLTSAALVHAEFQDVEAAMSEGHPAFIANNGRIGFDVEDFAAYAPESAAPVQLVWLAAHRRNVDLATSRELDYESLLQDELGTGTLRRFEHELVRQGLDPSEYQLIPAHPWQWFNRLATTLSADIAAGDLVCLGQGPDFYQAQQSVRTFFNVTHPHKRYVKTALSVLNMGFMRGLSPDYMKTTPAINDWAHALIQRDPYFEQCGFSILREVAGIGYRSPAFERAVPRSSPYRKMLAALWRESPVQSVKPGQRLLTMAALLHRDRSGSALLPQIVAASGLTPAAWMERYLDCYLAPLIHCLVKYDLAFMPHGENVILLLEGNVPVRAFMKDIGEEVVVMNSGRDVPVDVRRIVVSVPEELKALSIFTDVFDGIFRYLSQILSEQRHWTEEAFWWQVARCVHRYRAAHPGLASRDHYDLFAADFPHSCLNRLQLRNNRQMVDLNDPAQSLQFAGRLKNPIARFRDQQARALANLEPHEFN